MVENESGTRIIARIQALDRDVDALGTFFVASNETVWTNATFDYESNKTFYRLFITAYDGVLAWNSPTGQPNTQDFELGIQVLDVNDVPPDKDFRFLLKNYSFNCLSFY